MSGQKADPSLAAGIMLPGNIDALPAAEADPAARTFQQVRSYLSSNSSFVQATLSRTANRNIAAKENGP